MRRVAEIISVFAARQRRTGRWLDSDSAPLPSPAQLQAEERKCETSKIRATTRTSNDDIGIVARLLELLDRLLSDDGLVEQNVVEHRAERIFHRRILRRHLHRLRNGNT